MDDRTEEQREKDQQRYRNKPSAIKSHVKAVINSRYEHLGNQVSIEAEGYSNEALIVIMEMMVKDLKAKTV